MSNTRVPPPRHTRAPASPHACPRLTTCSITEAPGSLDTFTGSLLQLLSQSMLGLLQSLEEFESELSLPRQEWTGK